MRKGKNMNIRPINFTGKVTILNAAKKNCKQGEIKCLQQISNSEDIDLYIYKIQKKGENSEYSTFVPIGDSIHSRKFNFRNNLLVSSSISDIKPSFFVQKAVSSDDSLYSLKISYDKEHKEIVLGDKNSPQAIIYSAHDQNFRLGGYLGRRYTGNLFDRKENGELKEFSFEDGKLSSLKFFDKRGNLKNETQFEYSPDGSITAYFGKEKDENCFGVFYSSKQQDAIFSLIAKQFVEKV